MFLSTATFDVGPFCRLKCPRKKKFFKERPRKWFKYLHRIGLARLYGGITSDDFQQNVFYQLVMEASFPTPLVLDNGGRLSSICWKVSY